MTIGDVKKEPSHDSVSQKRKNTSRKKVPHTEVHLMPLTMRPTGFGSGIAVSRQVLLALFYESRLDPAVMRE